MTPRILLLALLAALANSVITPLFRKQGDAPGRPVAMQMGGMWIMAVSAAAALVFLGLPGEESGAFLLVSALSGLTATVNAYGYQAKVVHLGPVSISWAVVWMASVLIAAGGWGIFGEPVLLWQLPGMAAFLGCLLVMAWASYRTNRRHGAVRSVKPGYWTWLIVALVGGTLDGLLIKTASELLPEPGAASFSEHFAFILLRSMACGALLAAMCKVRRIKPAFDAKTWRLAALFALLFTTSLVLLLTALGTAPASELFPTYGGAAIILGTIWALLRGERPSRLAYLGVALAILAIVLINVGGPALWPGRGG